MLTTSAAQSLRHAPARRSLSVQCQSQGAAAQPVAKAAPRQPLISNRRQLLLGGLAASACSCCPPQPAQAAGWGYTCPGPDAWEGACQEGLSQSPIDIPVSALEPPIRFSYPENVLAGVINNGHGSPQVNFPEDSGCEVSFGGETYRLLQFHFHSPSEHTFNGKHTLMELHLVHKNVRTGDLCVLGVAMQAGADRPNACLDIALQSAPSAPGTEQPLKAALPIRTLLPKTRSADGMRPYVNYPGSLTTPPCTEGVNWVVFLDPIQVQASQVLDFLTFGNKNGAPEFNSRPVKPLGERQLRFYV